MPELLERLKALRFSALRLLSYNASRETISSARSLT
jgi:hypothetical protein